MIASVSDFSAWRGEARANWRLGRDSRGSAHVPPMEPLRALRRLRRQLPKAIRPRRTRLYRLCWDAVWLHGHNAWFTRDVEWLHPEHRLTVDGVPVLLEVSIRIHDETISGSSANRPRRSRAHGLPGAGRRGRTGWLEQQAAMAGGTTTPFPERSVGMCGDPEFGGAATRTDLR